MFFFVIGSKSLLLKNVRMFVYNSQLTTLHSRFIFCEKATKRKNFFFLSKKPSAEESKSLKYDSINFLIFCKFVKLLSVKNEI